MKAKATNQPKVTAHRRESEIVEKEYNLTARYEELLTRKRVHTKSSMADLKKAAEAAEKKEAAEAAEAQAAKEAQEKAVAESEYSSSESEYSYEDSYE